MFLCPLGRLLLLSLSQASTPINIIYIFVHGIVLYNLLRPTFVLFRIRYRYLTKQNFPLSTVKAANFVTFFTLFNFFSQKYLKVTIRPDWICMRVVPLESPLKWHWPLYVFDFLISVLNIWNNFKVLSRFMQNWIQSSCLFGSRFACAQAGVATLRSCTQRKRYRTCMLLNVAAHNVSIRNVKVSKRERHKTYSVTKRTLPQNVL